MTNQTELPDYLTLKQGNLQQLDTIAVNSPRGRIKLRFGATLELWFEDGYKRDKREALLAVWQDYFELFKAQMSHYHPLNSKRLKKITQSQFPEYYLQTLDTLDEEDPFYSTLYGYPEGKQVDGPCQIAIGGMADDNQTPDSDLQAYFPTAWLLNNPEQFVNVMKRWCAWLQPTHGIAGLGVQFEMGNHRGNDGKYAYPFITRFPGLDYADAAYFSLNTRGKRGIRGVNWLTVINNSYVEELGGRTSLGNQLDNNALVHDYATGVIIQAGGSPEIGDVNAGIWPEHYRCVNRVLRPIRFDDYSTNYLFVPDSVDAIEASQAWLTRFD